MCDIHPLATGTPEGCRSHRAPCRRERELRCGGGGGAAHKVPTSGLSRSQETPEPESAGPWARRGEEAAWGPPGGAGSHGGGPPCPLGCGTSSPPLPPPPKPQALSQAPPPALSRLTPPSVSRSCYCHTGTRRLGTTHTYPPALEAGAHSSAPELSKVKAVSGAAPSGDRRAGLVRLRCLADTALGLWPRRPTWPLGHAALPPSPISLLS